MNSYAYMEGHGVQEAVEQVKEHIKNHYPQLKEITKIDDFGIALIYLTFSLFAIF